MESNLSLLYFNKPSCNRMINKKKEAVFLASYREIRISFVEDQEHHYLHIPASLTTGSSSGFCILVLLECERTLGTESVNVV